MAFRRYIDASFNLLATLGYFSPWIWNARDFLGVYILAYFWLLIGWVFVPLHVFFGIRLRHREGSHWQHHLYSALITVLCYATVMVGIMNDFMVTV